VAPNYFDVFGASLLAGRGFGASDLVPTAGTAIVNRTFAQRILQGAQPLGRRFRYVGRSGDVRPDDVELGRWFEIVGVVEDFPPASMEPDMSPAKAYHALDAGLMHPLNLDVRFRRGVDPAALATRLREIAVMLDPRLRLDEILPLGEILREEQGMVRVGALAFLLVTISVLLFSAAGIYAMMSFAITLKRKEIGIRTALGAQPRRVLATILSRAAGQLALGVVVGALTAAMLNHVAEGDLVDNHAVAILSGVATLMVVVGILATLGPARRGLRIDPSEALRTDA
jgi:hypothetical protein